MTAYTKYPVGNKQFVIEWDLSVNQSEDQGDAFEAIDCELVSISALTLVSSGDVSSQLRYTNQSNFPGSPGVAGNYTLDLEIAGAGYFMPWPEPAQFVRTIPQARYYAPRLEGPDVGAIATAKVALLFRTL
jgi:hypothetical protein